MSTGRTTVEIEGCRSRAAKHFSSALHKDPINRYSGRLSTLSIKNLLSCVEPVDARGRAARPAIVGTAIRKPVFQGITGLCSGRGR